ncbi:MAG: caspase family protein [Planctomycetales bacterium]|nr:caspase family protein [Planctomycetales bacterium]
MSLLGGLAPRGACGEQWAVLIGVKSHDDQSLNLGYTDRDVESLKRVLTERSRIAPERLLQLSDLSGEENQPTQQRIKELMPEFLARLTPQDSVVIFYSGHGVELHGETYLVPKDFKRDEAAETAIPASWLHEQLRSCRAKAKFLILDSCHSGGVATQEKALRSSEIASALDVENVEGCFVLASCRSNELSYEWRERRNGVFTYWLCRALEGGADEDGDLNVTGDEVYSYVHERVKTCAKQIFKQSQRPARIISEDIDGADQVLLTLSPEPTESVCRRLADNLDLEIRFRGLRKVGVLEFLMPIGRRAGGLSHATLPKYCATEVRENLRQLAGRDYQVGHEGAFVNATKGVRVEDIGDPSAMRRLSTAIEGLDGVVTGDMRRRGRLLRVQCELVNTLSGETLIAPSGVLPLSVDLLVDSGASADLLSQPGGQRYGPDAIDWATDASHEGHPLLQNEFPFSVEVWTVKASATDTIDRKTPRVKKEYVVRETGDTNELVYGATEGEVFELRIRSDYRHPVTVAIAVDGINVLGQKRERLATARRWYQKPGQTYTYEGWYLDKSQSTRTGRQLAFERRRFVFTSLADSVAGRQSYGDSLGVISVAFFDANPANRGAPAGETLAVGEAQRDDQVLNSVPYHPGRLLSAVQLRYAAQDELR